MFARRVQLVAVEEDVEIVPKIKVSRERGQDHHAHFKKLYRFFGNDTAKAIADYICIRDEEVDDSGDFEIFDPDAI